MCTNVYIMSVSLVGGGCVDDFFGIPPSLLNTLLWDGIRLLQNIWTCYCCSLALSRLPSRSHLPLPDCDSIFIDCQTRRRFRNFHLL